jgi:hypothetical protein
MTGYGSALRRRMQAMVDLPVDSFVGGTQTHAKRVGKRVVAKPVAKPVAKTKPV